MCLFCAVLYHILYLLMALEFKLFRARTIFAQNILALCTLDVEYKLHNNKGSRIPVHTFPLLLHIFRMQWDTASQKHCSQEIHAATGNKTDQELRLDFQNSLKELDAQILLHSMQVRHLTPLYSFKKLSLYLLSLVWIWLWRTLLFTSHHLNEVNVNTQTERN